MSGWPWASIIARDVLFVLFVLSAGFVVAVLMLACGFVGYWTVYGIASLLFGGG